MDSCKKSLFCFIHHFPFQFNAGFIFTFHNFIKTTYDISLDSQISLITKRILSTRLFIAVMKGMKGKGR